jgi:hypothetical protein
MSVQTRDFVDVAARARELGCRVPLGIALLPGNFSAAASAGEFCYHAATQHVRSAWRSVGLDDEGPVLSDRGRRGQRTSVRANVAGPDAPSAQVPLVVLFGAGLLDGPAWRVTAALGMVSSVLASHPRCASPRDVRLDIVVERPGDHGYACIEYQGDAFGIVALARDVRRMWADK